MRKDTEVGIKEIKYGAEILDRNVAARATIFVCSLYGTHEKNAYKVGREEFRLLGCDAL
jgi:hypothetical protein